MLRELNNTLEEKNYDLKQEIDESTKLALQK